MTKPYQRRLFRYHRVDSKHKASGHVIVELGGDPLDDQRMEFFDQEYGEVRWHPFEPEDVERQEVHRLLRAHGDGPTGEWVQIDVERLRKSRSQGVVPLIAMAPLVRVTGPVLS